MSGSVSRASRNAVRTFAGFFSPSSWTSWATRRARKRAGAAALSAGGEVGVARRHREAVALADGGGDPDLHREAEVRHEAHHDGALLGVLLAEDGDVGEDEAEQAGDDGGDAVEVARAAGALHPLRDAGDVDRRGEAGRVDHVDRRGEEEVDAGLAELLRVGFEVARVALEVFPGPELGGVDEDGDDDLPGRLARVVDEGEVPGVERPHRRDEARCAGPSRARRRGRCGGRRRS